MSTGIGGPTPVLPTDAAAAAGELAALPSGTIPAMQSDGSLIGLSPSGLRNTACPAFSAGAASVAPGTLKVSEIIVDTDRTLAENSALTISATDAETGDFVLVTCRALTLGYTLAINNGGPGLGTLVTIPVSLTVPKSWLIYCNGTNWYLMGKQNPEVIG